MTQNVLEEVSACFTAPAVSQASAAVGESETGVRKALPKVVPLVLSSLIKLTEQIGGSEVVWTMAHHAHHDEQPNESVAASAAVGKGAARHGRELMKSLLADTYSNRVETVASTSGIKPTAVEDLLGIVAPVMLGVLDRHVTEEHLDSEGLSRWLQTQRSSVSGLLLEDAAAEATARNRAVAPPTPEALPPSTSKAAFWRSAEAESGGPVWGGPQRWAWPAAVVVCAVIIGFLLGQNRGRVAQPDLTTRASLAALPTAPAASRSVPAAAADGTGAATEAAATGRYDAESGNYIYDTGRPVRLTLVDGSTLTVGANSTENRLYHFLADANEQVDPVNRTKGWINFDRVYFDARKATLTDESMAQLRNVASILKSFPASRIKIGGYTDSTGYFKDNLRLSEQRAIAAMGALVDMGISAERIEAKGYGQKHGVASNETPVGRALNRRISVRVTQK
ncbi:OmpA family protein [Hymenobacter busanensis]|uniref:OmpA family protein n=1 Tax=Hymenobacter busanensis TaxID=2607656 RepID=A0A7L4ZWS5_9BACT|nr:OmpA family protein [Hymenobacter busanensis]KAA9325328.1 OmpA family protein [Hymenobacter busanensis]QHJ07678.1 OmpA family protein [Hymenobacter busanensis]